MKEETSAFVIRLRLLRNAPSFRGLSYIYAWRRGSCLGHPPFPQVQGGRFTPAAAGHPVRGYCSPTRSCKSVHKTKLYCERKGNTVVLIDSHQNRSLKTHIGQEGNLLLLWPLGASQRKYMVNKETVEYNDESCDLISFWNFHGLSGNLSAIVCL